MDTDMAFCHSLTLPFRCTHQNQSGFVTYQQQHRQDHGKISKAKRVVFATSTPPSPSSSSQSTLITSPEGVKEPLLIRIAKGQKVERPAVWLMRQAGRYMKAFREYSEQYPFRHRSETAEIAIELSLQPYHAFGTDAVIMFSDILTPLPSIGMEFDIVSGKGPQFSQPLHNEEERIQQLLRRRTTLEFEPQKTLPFISTILGELRHTLDEDNKGKDITTSLLGFVGAPFTLAAYMIEGKSTKSLTYTKGLMYNASKTAMLHEILDYLSDIIAQYAVYQLDCGAQAVQLFDSWAHHLSPDQYAMYAIPYVVKVIDGIRRQRPNAVIIFFANGSSGKLLDIDRHIAPMVNVVGVDCSVRMSAARQIFGERTVLQGNVDPAVLSCGDEAAIRNAVDETVRQNLGADNLIINLGHGVTQNTPEESVATFVDQVKRLSSIN